MGFHGAKYGLSGLLSSRLRSRHGTDRQTDDGHQRLMPLPSEVGGIISNRCIGTQVVSAAEVTFKRHSRSPAVSPFDTSHEFLISIPFAIILYSVAFCHFNLAFLSPGDAVRPIALNFAWTERHCHACKTPRSMYPSIYNSFPVIRTTIAKNRHFYVPRPSFFVCPGDAPVAITQNVA